MESASKLSAATVRRMATAHDDRIPSESHDHGEDPTEETLRLVESHRVNLLLMGDSNVVQPMVESLAARFHQPVGTWSPGEQLVLPPAERTGTMVLNDVGALGLQDQIQLMEWLGTAMGRTQVVSIASAPLLPRVQSGTFIDTLYYRLNTVCVDATLSAL